MNKLDSAIMKLRIALAESEAEIDMDKDDGLIETTHYKTTVVAANSYRLAINILAAEGKINKYEVSPDEK